MDVIDLTAYSKKREAVKTIDDINKSLEATQELEDEILEELMDATVEMSFAEVIDKLGNNNVYIQYHVEAPSFRDLQQTDDEGPTYYWEPIENELNSKLAKITHRSEDCAEAVKIAFSKVSDSNAREFTIEGLVRVVGENPSLEEPIKRLVLGCGNYGKDLDTECIEALYRGIDTQYKKDIPMYTELFLTWLNVLYMYHAWLYISCERYSKLVKEFLKNCIGEKT